MEQPLGFVAGRLRAARRVVVLTGGEGVGLHWGSGHWELAQTLRGPALKSAGPLPDGPSVILVAGLGGPRSNQFGHFAERSSHHVKPRRHFLP